MPSPRKGKFWTFRSVHESSPKSFSGNTTGLPHQLTARVRTHKHRSTRLKAKPAPNSYGLFPRHCSETLPILHYVIQKQQHASANSSTPFQPVERPSSNCHKKYELYATPKRSKPRQHTGTAYRLCRHRGTVRLEPSSRGTMLSERNG